MRFKKGPWKQNIFSVEHDSKLQVQKKHRKISDTNRMKRLDWELWDPMISKFWKLVRCNPCLQNFCIGNREKLDFFAYGDSRSIVTKRCKIYNHFKPAKQLSQHLQRCGLMYLCLNKLSNVLVVSSWMSDPTVIFFDIQLMMEPWTQNVTYEQWEIAC